MTNALIILIILAAFLLLISLVISKSSLPENDKIMSLILILVVFSFVAVLNESKRSSITKSLPLINITNETQRINSKSFERTFYQSPESIKIPFFSTKLLNFSEFFSKDFQRILLLYGKGKIGKTTEILHFIQEKQQMGSPILYVDCEGVSIGLRRFLERIRLDNYYILDEILEKMNKIYKIPTIIIDNFQGFEGNSCEICGLLGYLYDRRKLNILIVTNNGFVVNQLKYDHFLMNRIEIINIESKKEVLTEFIHEINRKLNQSKNINETQMVECEKLTEIDYEFLNDYEKNVMDFENFLSFCRDKIKKIYEKLKLEKYNGLFKAFLKLSYDEKNKKYENKFLAYGELKAQKIERFEELLEEGLKRSLIEGENGKYRIMKRSVYNSLVMALA